MPTYTYLCKSCSSRIDLQRYVDERDEPVECECGFRMTRTITAAPVHFKGTGFYKTGD
jgi:putative FmdB family regulatory protein